MIARGGCRLLAFLIALVLLAAPAAAAAPDSSDATPARTFVTLRVNTVVSGETVAVLTDGDVFLSASALAGIKVPLSTAATHRQFFGDDFVSLRSLSDKLSYKLDENELILDVTLKPALFGTSIVNLGQEHAAAPAAGDRSAYFNYSVTADQLAGFSEFAESGATIGAGRLYTSFSDNATSGFDRGLTNLTFDSRDSMRTMTFGDTLATGGDLGGNPYLAGVQVGRQFNLNPYFVQFPTLNFAGSIAAPGRADVYVNGVLVRTVQLTPGQFSLQGLAPPSGASNTQVVVTDTLGRSTVLGGPYYGSGSLLRAGLTDYQYSVGFLRPDAFGADDRYSDLGYMARYRIGLSNDVSLGGRFEGTGSLVSGGPVLDVGSRFGTFHLAGAVSRSGATKGDAADFSYAYSSPRFGFSSTFAYESNGYATTSLPIAQDRATSGTSFAGSYTLSRQASFSVELTHADYRDSGAQSSASAYLTFGLNKLSVSLGATKQTGSSILGVASSGISYFMTAMLGGTGRTSSTLESSVASGKTTNTLQVQESMPVGQGFGYRAAISNDPASLFAGDARYNGAIGTYDLTTGVPSSGRADSTLTIAGGLADVDGKFALSRPLTDSFALIDVPGQSNVHVYLNGQDMGVTDRSGHLVVDNVVPNYDNHISIDEPQTAFDTEITSENEQIAPGIRSGALVRYGVRKISALTGKVVVRVAGVDVVPAAGAFTLTARSSHADSDLGEDGEFYFENVAAGAYSGLIRYAGGSCTFPVTIPATSGVITNLGTLSCARASH